MDNKSKLSLFPVREKEWELYKEAQSYFWKADEMDLKDVREDYKSLEQKKQKFVRISTAAAIEDFYTFRRIYPDLLKHFKQVEFLSFIGCQIRADQNHCYMHSRLLASYLDMKDVKNTLFDVEVISDDDPIPESEFVEELPCDREKGSWLDGLEVVNTADIPLFKSVVVLACLKGVLGSIRFAGGLWHKKEKKMKGFYEANDLIFREFELHLEFAGSMFKSLKEENTIDDAEVVKLVKQAVELEKSFGRESGFCEAYCVEESAMNSHIEYNGDKVLVSLGCPKIFESSEPISFGDVGHLERDKSGIQSIMQEDMLTYKQRFERERVEREQLDRERGIERDAE